MLTPMPLHPDSFCKGIAKREDLKPGVVLWHVYGHIDNEPTRCVVLGVPVSTCTYYVAIGSPLANGNLKPWFPTSHQPESDWVRVRCDPHGQYIEEPYEDWFSLQDCGIGANYNTNRLLLSREAALKYHSAALAWNNARKINGDPVFDWD